MKEPKKKGAADQAIFDLKDMSVDEMKSMFMRVSVKSLDTWMDYYQGKEQYEICKLIKEIRDYKNGHVTTEDLPQ